MTFEEDFPGLNKELPFTTLFDNDIEAIAKHCLDKARVKEEFEPLIAQYEDEEEWSSSHDSQDTILELESKLRTLVQDLKFHMKELGL